VNVKIGAVKSYGTALLTQPHLATQPPLSLPSGDLIVTDHHSSPSARHEDFDIAHVAEISPSPSSLFIL
jgi:hypothetical protein